MKTTLKILTSLFAVSSLFNGVFCVLLYWTTHTAHYIHELLVASYLAILILSIATFVLFIAIVVMLIVRKLKYRRRY